MSEFPKSKALEEFMERAKRLNLPEPMPDLSGFLNSDLTKQYHGQYLEQLRANSYPPYSLIPQLASKHNQYCSGVTESTLLGDLLGGKTY